MNTRCSSNRPITGRIAPIGALLALFTTLPPAAAQGVMCANNLVDNGDFSNALVPGSMPSGSVANWSLITASPQVVTDGCAAAGALQMWGNQTVGESVQQALPGPGFVAGRSYRITVCYRWLDNNPILPQYVRFRLTASAGAAVAYPPSTAADVIGVTPNSATMFWNSYTFPIWTAPNNASHLTINPENDETLNHGDYVSWGQIDDVCIEEVLCGVVSNGDFSQGLVPGSMPSASVTDWSLLTASPQVVTDGCAAPGAMQMWGNMVVGESIQQALPGAGIQAGKTYSITVCYRWLDNANPVLPPYVRFRLKAFGSAPAGYPPTTVGSLIGITPNTSSTFWTSYVFPNWTAPANAAYLTVNPENDETVNHGDFVSWGLIDDICITEVETPPYISFCNGDGGDQLGCTNCPCGNEAPIGTVGGCLNSFGSSAVLLPSGLPDVTNAADTLHFNVAGATTNSFGLLVSGADRLTNNPNNPCFLQNPGSGVLSIALDGLRCVGNGVIRHGTRATDGFGSIGFNNSGWGPPNAPLSGIGITNGFLAGQTRHFQVFYRETASLGCNTGQNTTNAVSVTFL